MNKKLTPLEKKWILYDVGNSAFTMLATTILPIYFNYLAESAHVSAVNYMAFWGYAASISTLLVALLGPTLGSLADTQGYKKKLFTIVLLIGVIGCIVLGVTSSWIIFLVIFIITKTGYATSLIFYDSMLTDVTTEDRMDRVSSYGYAWGYIGSCVPFVASIGIVLGADSLGLKMPTAMLIAFAITALWWLGNTIPLLKSYQQKYYSASAQKDVVRSSFKRLGGTFREIAHDKKVLFFLLAFFFYIDGVYTIIDMAIAYGQALGLDSTGLLLALLVTQLVAFPCALLFGRFSDKFQPSKMLSVCIIAYFGIALYAIWLDSQVKFWTLAVLVGMFQGTIQALSRSYFAKIIPAEKSGEYFGILDICGKGAAFFGTFLVSFVSQMTGLVNAGVGSLSLMFLLGFFFFRKAAKLNV